MSHDTEPPNDVETESHLSTERRHFLQAAGLGAVGLTALGGMTAAQDDDGTIVLDAVTVETGGAGGRSEYVWEDGTGGVARGPPEAVCDVVGGQEIWMGVSPGSIEDVVNPTLELTAGQEYTVEWTNQDGKEHDFVIVDGDGNELVSSDSSSSEGETVTVDFEATAEMAAYRCGTHPGSQSGDIAVGGGPDAGRAVPTGVQFWTLRGLGSEDLPAEQRLSTADVIRLVGGADNNGGPGYEVVEPFRMNDSTPAEIRTALDETGLEAPAAHIGLGSLEDNLDQHVADWHETIGATSFVINFIPEDQMDTVDEAMDLVDRMNAVAESLPDDVRLGYHNHNQEFIELGDGRTPMQIFDENLNDDVVFEIDVGWTYYAGEDPVEVLETYSDRTQFIHLKEMNLGEEEGDEEFFTLGEGPMDVVEIADAARNVAEVDAMFYENDEPPEEKSELSTAMGVMSFVDGQEGLECLDFADVGREGYDGSLEGVPMGTPADEDGVPTGIQLYTLRNLPDSVPQLIRRVGAIDDNGGPGYDTIEFAGLGDASPSDVQAALDETGVDAAAAHLGLSNLQGDSLQGTLDTYYSQLGVTDFIEPVLNVPDDATAADVEALAQEFNDVAANLPDDARVGFHNHAAVFQELDDGRTILEALDEHLNDDVIFEIDVGWVYYAGSDPAQVIGDYSDRVAMLHMKDMVRGVPSGEAFRTIGEGGVDWEAVGEVARSEADVDYMFYEHDAPTDPAGTTGTGSGVLSFLDGAPGLQECMDLTDVGGPDYDGDLSGAAPEEVNILLFSATGGFRHGNIGYGLQRLQEQEDRIAELADVETVNIDTIAEDASAFPSDASALMQYDTVVWFNTTDNVLEEQAQRDAFEEYIQNGGGYAGIHAASDTHHPGAGEWDFYQGLIGDAYFIDHPIGGGLQIQEADVRVTDSVHPSTDHLPARWSVEDEWYNFATNPRGDVHVLATLDESTYDLGDTEGMGEDHPISWAQEYQGGRAWYTGRGHTEAAFDEEAFIEHVLGGILWAGGFLEGDATGTVWDTYETTQLATDIGEPMKIDTLPDGRVLYTERGTGEVRAYDPDADEFSVALTLDVYTGQEDGLQGVAVDPDFEDTGWVYLYYAPAGDESVNRLSRFTMDGDTIDPDIETQILDVDTQRDTCCHVGGDIAFGPDGEELYLSTGDDTNPFEIGGYAPVDELSGEWTEDQIDLGPDEEYEDTDRYGMPHRYWDAQRTSANTNDLRGSILRIVPNEDGSYDVPDDNLFTGPEYADARENDLVREEIYGMGFRNPFTIWVDDETGLLFVADYGPDADVWSADRGPPGIVEFVTVEEPGFYGWPYFTGSNIPYREYNFDTDESGEPFDPENPINDSPNAEDGLTELPPAKEATIYYSYDWEDLATGTADVPEYAQEYVPEENPWPEIAGGGAPMTGPLYRSADDHGEAGLSEYYDGKWFLMEWGNNWVKYASFDDEGNLLDIEPFLPDQQFNGPQDMTVGQNGELYLLEYGNCFFGCEDSGMVVIEQTGAEPGPGPEPEPVSIPYGLDSGGESHEDPVSVEGLEFDKLPNDAVTQTGDHTAASLLDSDTEFTIDGTDSELLYKTEHYGTDIGYDVEVPNGTYDVTLHFAEIWWGIEGRGGTDTGVGNRVFDVSIQGETVLSEYDIYEEVGALTATTETIEDVEVTDGVLRVESTTISEDFTKFSGIEVREADDEPEGVSAPFGYDAGGGEVGGTVTIDGLDYVAQSDFVTATGDAGASADDTTVASGSTGDSISGTENDALHQSEQYGGNLSYDVTIANGTYDVTLYFTEIWFGDPDAGGGGTGSREFDVSVGGQQVFSPLDIYDMVGHDAALTETVEGVEVSDGTLDIDTTTVTHNSQISGFAIHEGDDPEAGLEAHIPLDGDSPTNEVTGNAVNLQGDVATGQSGVVGSAIEVSTNGEEPGQSNYTAANAAVTEPLPLNGEAATVAAWMNVTDFEQYGRAPFQVGGSPDTFPAAGWDVEFSDTTAALIPQESDDGNPARGSGGDAIGIDPETWYFVAGVVDGGDLRLHVFDQDGELDSSPQTWSGSRTQSSAEPLILGAGDGREMAGRIDDVWGYSRALSESDVAALHQESSSGGDDGEPEPTVTVVTDDDLGDILADGDGNVLYMWDNDTQGEGSSACTGDCTDNWPPLTVDDAPVAGESVAADLTTFERSDGSTQVAANGWPLYYFANDENPGDTNGQGLPPDNPLWWVLDPAGMPIRDDGGLPPGAIDPSETITLDAPSTSEWTGVSPSSIEGETDPTLTLAAGEEYTMEWTNSSPVGHSLEIGGADYDGGSGGIVTNPVEMEGYSFPFTASEDMTQYFCQPHYLAGMAGSIEVVSNE